MGGAVEWWRSKVGDTHTLPHTRDGRDLPGGHTDHATLHYLFCRGQGGIGEAGQER